MNIYTQSWSRLGPVSLSLSILSSFDNVLLSVGAVLTTTLCRTVCPGVCICSICFAYTPGFSLYGPSARALLDKEAEGGREGGSAAYGGFRYSFATGGVSQEEEELLLGWDLPCGGR